MSQAVLTSVLFTDLVDSTALASRLGPERSEELRRTHFGLLRDAIATAGGTEVKNLGDGLMVTFASPSSALVGATGIQKAVARHNGRASDPLRVRIGVSVGEAYADDGDYFGESVIEAARLCAAAEGGQILATELVRTMVGRHSPFGFRVVGDLNLKGLPEPVATVEVMWESAVIKSPVPFPSMLAGVTRDRLFGFVGRVDELALVAQAQKVAFTEPRLQTVVVGGEAGIGKTAMIAHASALAHELGSIVLLGHCDEEVTTPYQVWMQAFALLADHLGDGAVADLAPSHRRALARLVPSFGASEAPPVDAESDRVVLVHAVEALLRSVAADHPLVVVLDDLHWADAASLHVLRHLISSAAEIALVILCTYRHTDLNQNEPLAVLLADLHRQPGVTRVKLVGLGDSETVQLVELATGHELDEGAVRFAHALRRETDGNPFFTRELLRHLDEMGRLSQTRDGRSVLEQGSEQGLPASIRDVVGRRVGRLGADAGRTLSVASVLGRDFSLDVLAAVAESNDDELLELLEAATAAALVFEIDERPGSYRFAHALIQRTLYEDLGAARRARIHRRAAEVLENLPVRGKNRAAMLAHHWVAAFRPSIEDKALRYVVEAADEALAGLAPEDAIGWYRQALDLVSRSPECDDALKGRLLVGMGTAQRQVGDENYRRSLIEAGDLARGLADTDLQVAAILAADRGVAGTSGADVEWVKATEAALIAIGPEDSVARARLLSILSQSIHSREWQRRRELSIAAVEVARRLGDGSTLTAVLPVAYQHYWPEEVQERQLDTALAISLAKQRGTPIALCNALFHRIDACIRAGDLNEADQRIAELSTEARTLGLPLHLWQMHMVTSLRALLSGDSAASESSAELALNVGSAGGHVEAMAVYGSQLIEIRRYQGRLAEAVGFLEAAAGENAAVVGFRQLLAALYADLRRDDDAAPLLAQDQETDFEAIPRDAAWLTIMSCCASAAAAIGALDACRSLYNLLEPHAGQVAAVYATTSGSVARHLGRMADVLGRTEVAEAHLRKALAVHERMAAPYWTATTQLDLAELLLRRGAGGAEHAAVLIAQARRTAAERDYGGLIERLSRLAAP